MRSRSVRGVGASSDPARIPTIVPRRSLTEDVYETLSQLLMDQVIEPGSRMSIEGLAQQLGVSATPVRESFARLESEGLVVKQNRGALRGFTAATLLDDEGLRQLFEMRQLLEPRAAHDAASRIDGNALQQLTELNLQMHEAAAEPPADGTGYATYRQFATNDATLHEIIARASGNPLLAEAITRLRAHRHLYRLYFQHGIAHKTDVEHTTILNALMSGDADLAGDAMLAHIDASYSRIVDRSAPRD